MKKIITFGVFDYFHLGHLKLFENCKKYGDYLIVAVQDGNFILKFKPDSKIFYSTGERVHMVESLRVVDKVIVYEELTTSFLATIDFDVLAEDHTAERFVNAEKWCAEHGKEVVRMKRTPGICSSDIKSIKG